MVNVSNYRMSVNFRFVNEARMPANCFTLLLFLLMLHSENMCGQKTLLHLCSDGTANRYELTFTEDFDGGIDWGKWITTFPWGTHLIPDDVHTQELYTDRNLTFGNGIGSFTAKKERTCGKCVPYKDSAAILETGLMNYRCFDYSSAMLHSVNDYSYGWYEIRFKTSPDSKGLWPAFWLFGNSNEIDIFENKGERSTETHWDVHCKDGCKGKKGGWIKSGVDFSEKFNTISLQWHPDGMRWYLNGRLYKSTAQFFNNRMHIIVNNAVSRTRGKEGFWIGPDNTTIFPSTLEVDYIYHYKNIYTGRYLKKNTSETNALNILMRNDFIKEFNIKKVKARSKQKMFTSVVYDAEKRSVTVIGISGKTSAASIYNDSGKLIGNIFVAPGVTKEWKDIPSETIIIIVRNGKSILADKINARR